MHLNYLLHKVSEIGWLEVQLKLLSLDLRVIKNVADHGYEVLSIPSEGINELLHVRVIQQMLRQCLSQELSARVDLCQGVPQVMNHPGHIIIIVFNVFFELADHVKEPIELCPHLLLLQIHDNDKSVSQETHRTQTIRKIQVQHCCHMESCEKCPLWFKLANKKLNIGHDITTGTFSEHG